MTHDDVRAPANVRFQSAGTGLAQTFKCGACQQHRTMPGRRLQVVRHGLMRGMRAWVCAGCVR